MEATVGGKDAAIEPQGWVYGVLTKGNAPAFSFSEQHCKHERGFTPLSCFIPVASPSVNINNGTEKPDR